MTDNWQEDQWEFDDESTNDDIIGYYCIACGHQQDDDDWGGECEVCTGKCLEEVFA